MTKKVEAAKSWSIYVLLVVVSLSATFFGIQWEQTEAEVKNLRSEVVRIEETTKNDLKQLESEFRSEIARLDESNRNRRNDLAELEQRVARLEERTGGSP